jgi:hypothetical protein
VVKQAVELDGAFWNSVRRNSLSNWLSMLQNRLTHGPSFQAVLKTLDQVVVPREGVR